MLGLKLLPVANALTDLQEVEMALLEFWLLKYKSCNSLRGKEYLLLKDLRLALQQCTSLALVSFSFMPAIAAVHYIIVYLHMLWPGSLIEGAKLLFSRLCCRKHWRGASV